MSDKITETTETTETTWTTASLFFTTENGYR